MRRFCRCNWKVNVIFRLYSHMVVQTVRILNKKSHASKIITSSESDLIFKDTKVVYASFRTKQN